MILSLKVRSNMPMLGLLAEVLTHARARMARAEMHRLASNSREFPCESCLPIRFVEVVEDLAGLEAFGLLQCLETLHVRYLGKG